MKKITSIQNEWIKNILKLNDKKYCKQSGKCFVETYKIVKECVVKGIVDTIILTEEKAEKYCNLFHNIVIVTDAIAKKLSNTMSTDGVFAIVNIPSEKGILDESVLVLDHIQDPSNMGAIIRTACASGYRDIILLDCTYPYVSKVIRSSMGYVFDVCLHDFTIDNLKELKKEGYSLLCADMSGDNIFEINEIPTKHLLVIGNEGNGVDQEIRKLVTQTVSIPMENGVESLNASVSASILMYEIKNKTRRV